MSKRLGDKLPRVTSQLPVDVRRYLDRVRDVFNGASGELLTVEGLRGLGVIDNSNNLVVPDVPDDSGNLGIPPAVTNLDAGGAFQNIIIEWDTPEYFGHAYTEIWASDIFEASLSQAAKDAYNDLDLAKPIAITSGAVYTDYTGGGKGRYYWARNVNTADTAGPFNAVGGEYGATAPDVDLLLTTLTDSITESQLYQDLGDKVDLIEPLEAYTGYLSSYSGDSLVDRIGGSEQDVTVLQVGLSDAESDITATSTAVSALDTRVTSAEGTITSQGTLITGLQSSLTDAESDISGNATNITSLDTRVTSTEGDITALSTSVSTLSTTVGDNTTSIQTNATSIDGLEGQYSVKIDNNGYVTGFGLSSTPVDGVPFSEMIIRADRFSIGSGNTDIIPFIVTTSTTTLNGVSVPAGVYIDQAYIKNGAISNAKIGSAAIDSAKIADAAITNAKIGTAAINSAKIEDAAITNAKIENAAITSAKIADATIDNAKIADAAITNAKIGDAAITSAKIGSAAITNAKIGDAAITSAKIGDAAITNAKIGDAAITTAKIGDLAVDTLQIAGEAVTVPIATYTSTDINLNNNTTIQQATIIVDAVSASSSILITLNTIIRGLGVDGDTSKTSISLYRGTTLLRTFTEVVRLGYNQRSTVTLMYKDTPGVGTHTYYFKATSPAEVRTNDRTVTLLQVKK